jgi:hypothetical protein
MPDDCCPTTGCLGPYPNNYTCNGGVCRSPQCASDQDCTFGGTITGYVCKAAKGLMACLQPCTGDGDCSGTATCARTADDGTKYCAVVDPPCANDADCGAGSRCQATVCVCADDSFCGGAGKCNKATGDCTCGAEADCSGAAFAKHCAF